MKKTATFVISTLFVLVASGAAFAQTITYRYVRPWPAGADYNSGMSWGSAYETVERALEVAASLPKPVEIWVAGGTYDIYSSLKMQNGVTIRGGFQGISSETPATFNPATPRTNETTLSGGNSRRVFNNVFTPETRLDETAVLDSVTISNGRAADGAGMYNVYSDPKIINCTFSANAATASGGGMHNSFSNPKIAGCTFSGNFVSGDYGRGAGMANVDSSSPEIADCEFKNNTISGISGTGAGMANVDSSSPTVTDCEFIANVMTTNNAANTGGGMANVGSSSPTVTGCTFSGNSTSGSGGYGQGGGMANTISSNPTVADCTFDDNKSASGGGMWNANSSNPSVADCTFSGNTAGIIGGGMYNTNRSSPEVVGCVFDGNDAARSGGGMYNSNSNPKVAHCTFSGNTATDLTRLTSLGGGGGGMANETSNPTVSDCTFSGNTVTGTTGSGGGMANQTSSAPALFNCTFSSNEAHRGAGVGNDGSSSPAITHCTFGGNIAAVTGGGVYNKDVGPMITNCIVWGNLPAAGQITDEGDSASEVNYSIVQGGWDEGVGNIGDEAEHDPLLRPLGDYGGRVQTMPVAEDSPAIGLGATQAQIDGILGEGEVAIPTVDANGRTRNTLRSCTAGAVEVFTIIYVDGANAAAYEATPEAFGGTSWATAFPMLTQEIIDAVDASVIGGEVWIATGEYVLPETLTMRNGVRIFGSFAGTENHLCEREMDALGKPVHETVLDGGGDKRVFENDFSEEAEPLDASAVLDSVTVANGYTANDGGGMFNSFASPTIVNCTFEGNEANGGGGMANVDSSSPTIAHCMFSGNVANGGGGMYNLDSSNPIVSDCTFSKNQAVSGGGMLNQSSNPTVTTCIFIENQVDNQGGGIFNIASSSPLVSDCTFIGNEAGLDGGGINNNVFSATTVTNCTFSGNKADRFGGGMFNSRSSPPITITNCTFDGNEARSGGGMANLDRASPTITGCSFSENQASESGGGIYNFSSASPTITDCTFSENQADGSGGGIFNTEYSAPSVANCTFAANTADSDGGGIYNNLSSPTVTDCTFSGNQARDGGGMYNNQSLSPTLANCTFAANTATGDGGGIYNNASSRPTIADSTFVGNQSRDGAGMYNRASSNPALANCTFAGNAASGDGGGMYNLDSSNPTLLHCTLAGNTATAGGAMYNNASNPTIANSILWGSASAIANAGGSAPRVAYSIVQTADADDDDYTGTENLNADPMLTSLVDTAGYVQTMHVQPGSAAIYTAGTQAEIDAVFGTDTVLLPTTDALGQLRDTTQPSVTMGTVQSPIVPFLTLNMTEKNLTVIGTGEAFLVIVSSNIYWRASKDIDWLTVSPTNGALVGAFLATPELNTGAARSGTVTVKGARITCEIAVSQAPPVNQAPLTLTSGYSWTYNGGNYTARCDGGSGSGTVTWTMTPGTGEGSITSGGVLTVTKAGTFTLTATMAASPGYYVRSDSWTLTVGKADQAPLTLSYDPNPVAFGSTSSPNAEGGTGGGALSYAVQSGTATVHPVTGVLTPTGDGTATVRVTRAATDLYNEVTRDCAVTITKIPQDPLTISPANPWTYNPDGNIFTVGGGNGNGDLVYGIVWETARGDFDGTTVTFTRCGTFTLNATKAASGGYNGQTGSWKLTVDRAEQEPLTLLSSTDPIDTGTPYRAEATGGSGEGSLRYSVVSGPATIIASTGALTTTGHGTVKIKATKLADDLYAEQTLEWDLVINKVPELTLNPTSAAGISWTGATFTFTVSSNIEWTASVGADAQSWLQIDTPEGEDNADITVTVAANSAAALDRTGAITIRGKDGFEDTVVIFSVTQSSVTKRPPNSVYETKVTARTSVLKEMTVRFTAASGIKTVFVHYRTPVNKRYTILMAYNGGGDADHPNTAIGRMWAADKQKPFKLGGDNYLHIGWTAEDEPSYIGKKRQNIPEEGSYYITDDANAPTSTALHFSGLATLDWKNGGRVSASTGVVSGENFAPLACQTDGHKKLQQGQFLPPSPNEIDHDTLGQGNEEPLDAWLVALGGWKPIEGIYYPGSCYINGTVGDAPGSIGGKTGITKPAHFFGTYTTRYNAKKSKDLDLSSAEKTMAAEKTMDEKWVPKANRN